jgi:hypothetical protein
MTVEDTKIAAGDRQRFAEMKKSIVNLAPADRVTHEVRLAREIGITVTASEAASITRPTERRIRIHAEPLLHAAASYAPMAAAEVGQTADLGVRRSMSEVLKASAFMPAVQAGCVRDMLKALRSGGNIDALVTRLDPLLELLASHGEHEDLVREAKTAYAQTIFASSDPMKSKKGVGGEPND